MTSTELDDEIRAATFAFILQLRDRFGGRIPAAQLSAGIVLRGERIPIWNQQKGIFKPAALGLASTTINALHRPIHFGQLARTRHRSH